MNRVWLYACCVPLVMAFFVNPWKLAVFCLAVPVILVVGTVASAYLSGFLGLDKE